MSGRVFKRARQLARKVTAGQKANQLVGKEHQIRRNGKDFKTVQALNAPGSTRAVYRQFKKLMRRGMAIGDIEQSIMPQLQPKAIPADAPSA